MRTLRIAIRFLTRLPVPGDHALRPGELAASFAWHPVVGAGVGALLGLVAMGLSGLDPLVRAALLTVLAPLLTGAMHEDALADAADGLGGGRDRERALEIMRDSRVGAYGALAASGAMILRFAALTHADLGPLSLAAVFGCSRLAGVLLVWALPPARTGGAVSERPRPGHALFALACAAAWGRPDLLALTLGLTLGWGLYVRQRVGGITGDLAGAAILLAELGGLVLG